MPLKRTTSRGYQRARALRKELTPAERKLWAYLRGNKLDGLKFRRQHALGPYIVDFCAIKARLIIELDGGQHLEQAEYDAERTAYLEGLGFKVIRFWNNQVMQDISGVILSIRNALETPPDLWSLSPNPQDSGRAGEG